jgi:two-component system response regulator ResD
MTSPHKPTILIVDDDPLVLDAMYELFYDDFTALLARTGEKALEFAEQQLEIDAVVLDIKMAGMDGVETCRRLKVVRPGLPFIIHTGFPGAHQRQQIETLLAPFAYIIKGRSFLQLIQAVRLACNMGATEDPGSD